MSSTRSAYRGSRRRLVLAFDVGIDYSCVSYSVLDPGQIPEIKIVTRFPGHEYIGGASRIPTIIYYDRQGKVRAVGAEAMRDGIFDAAENNDWVKAEWFILHLRSKIGAGKNVSENLPPLPPNKTVVDVFADFLRYMLQCASSYIQYTCANGDVLWPSIKDDIDFILSHPDEWDAKEHNQMRRAAIAAGLVPDSPGGHARISFVAEGEARLHFTFMELGRSLIVKVGEGIIIVNTTRGALDASTYRCNEDEASHNCEEIVAPERHLEGSAFISRRARIFLEGFLENSRFLDNLDDIMSCFDKTTMLRFRNQDEPQYVKFGSTRDNDSNINVRFGQLKLSGSQVAMFFEPTITSIVDAVLSQRQKCTNYRALPQHVILMGEMAAQDWVFNKVLSSLQQFGLTLLCPEKRISTVVSYGSICFYLDAFLRSHVSNYAYGCFCPISYVPMDFEHRERSAHIIKVPSGEVMVDDFFAVILPKNARTLGITEFRYSFHREAHSRWELNEIISPTWRYSGNGSHPRWKDIEDRYTLLCRIVTDFSHLPLKTRRNSEGDTYYRLDYDVVFIFSLMNIKVQVSWKENGIEKRSPAEILSEDAAQRSQGGDGRD